MFKHLQLGQGLIVGVLLSALAPVQAQTLPFRAQCYMGLGSNAGFLVVMGELRNTQGTAVNARGNIRVYNTSGALMYERLGAIANIDLKPGESAPIYDRSSTRVSGKPGRCELLGTFEPADKFAKLERGQVSNLSMDASAFTATIPSITLRGKIKNPLAQEAGYRLYITGYNAAGDVVLYNYSTSTARLGAGSTASFESKTFTAIQKPVRFTSLVVLQP